MLVWSLAGGDQLSRKARQAIDRRGSIVYVSAISVWEIEIKRLAGRMEAPDNLAQELIDGSFLPLDLTTEHALAAARLPRLHGDPFDRMLVAQATLEGLTIVTRDPAIAAYGVPTLWD